MSFMQQIVSDAQSPLGLCWPAPPMKKNGAQKTRREKVEQREATIVAAAHDVFMEHGIEGARIAEIAQRAQVAEGTLYLYFRGKEALLQAVVEAFFARLTESAEQGVRRLRSTRKQLAFLAQHHMLTCLGDWRIIELAASSMRVTEYRNSEFLQYNKKYVAVFNGVIRDGMNRGELRDDITPHAARDLFYGGLDHACRSYLVRGGPVDNKAEISRMARRMVDLFWRAIAVGPDEPGPPDDLGAVTQRLEAVATRLERLDGRADPD